MLFERIIFLESDKMNSAGVHPSQVILDILHRHTLSKETHFYLLHHISPQYLSLSVLFLVGNYGKGNIYNLLEEMFLYLSKHSVKDIQKQFCGSEYCQQYLFFPGTENT